MACSKASPLTEQLSSSNASFCRNFYQKLAGFCDGENIFMSPYSIFSVLAIAYMGADGDTASEMARLLNLTEKSQLAEMFQEYGKRIFSLDTNYVISTANKLLVRKDKKLSKDYLEKCRLMKAGTEVCDFAGNPEGVCEMVNAWVAAETHEKIQNVLSAPLMSKDTCLMIINTIYFKGLWINWFDPACTRSDQFVVSPSHQARVDMMHVTEDFGYKKLDDLQCTALELPYKSEELSMVIFLPYTNHGLEEVEQNLTVDHLKNSYYPRREVNVALPRFKMESEFELSDVLISMGMKSAFSPVSANFGRMDPAGLITISKVIHKSFVEVNEYGTEAAACTVMDCVDGIMLQEPVFFTADHPFLFFIRDNKSDVILFMGRLMNPEGLETAQPNADWLT